jgi:membrane protein
MNAKMWTQVFKGSYKEFGEDKVMRLSAALAYYAIFSIAPLIIIVISVAGLVFGTQAVTGQIQGQLRGIIGDQGAQMIESMITAASKPHQSIIATIIGVATLLIGASGVFGQLQDALNTIWEVKPKPGRGILGMLRDRFLSMAMVLGTGFLLLISMVLSAALSALTGMMGNAFGMGPVLAEILHNGISFVVITLLFAMIFKVLPDAQVKWRDVWPGAIFTTALFILGKLLLGLYLGRAATASAYGAAGSLIIVLLWVYYSSVILFFGAEFTQVFAKARGSRIVPAKHAIGVTEETRGEEGIPHEEWIASQVGQKRSKDRSRGSAGSSPVPAHAKTKIPSDRIEAPARYQEPAPEVVAFANREWEHLPKGAEIIQRKPWPFLSAAVGIGLLSGWIFKGEWLMRHKTRG